MKISAANLPHLLAAAVLLAALATPAATAIAATSPRDADALAKSTYIYIATVRKDGNQSTSRAGLVHSNRATTNPDRNHQRPAGKPNESGAAARR